MMEVEGQGYTSILAYPVPDDDPWNLVYTLSNRGEKALRGEIKAVWEREFKLKSNSYSPSTKKKGAVNDEEWKDEIGKDSVDIPTGTRFWKGIMSCKFPVKRLAPRHDGVKYAIPVLHLYWRTENSNEWILLRCDADYLFNCNYTGGYIWDETTNYVKVMPTKLALKFIYHEYIYRQSVAKSRADTSISAFKIIGLDFFRYPESGSCMVLLFGKIEGNTYTYVETEALLKDGITSEKRYEDAKMLKNLHNLFVSEMEYIHKGKNTEIIDERTLLRLHSGLSSGLVSDEEAGLFRTRPVRISGTDYVPPRDVYEIRFKLSEVLYRQTELENPLERAVYLHCNIARIQPFIDCNKRTARLVESIVMMNAGLIPVYSAKDADILNYRKGLISFYENETYSLYTDYFLDRQLVRIKELTTDARMEM